MENKWLIDCWLVNAQRQIWHAYLGQEQVQQVNIQMIQIWEKNRTIWTTIDLIIVLKIIGCLVGAKILSAEWIEDNIDIRLWTCISRL